MSDAPTPSSPSSSPPPRSGARQGPPGSSQRGSTLGLRLALLFLSVALAAVALMAVLAAVFTAVDVSSLANQQRSDLANATAAAAAASWERNHGWEGTDLRTVLDLAAHSGVGLQVRDSSNRPVATTAHFSAAGPRSSAPVLVDGRQVGTVLVGLTGSGLGGANDLLRTALLRAIAGTAGLAALLALITGLAVARRITRPVARLIAVTRAMGHGDRAARVGP